MLNDYAVNIGGLKVYANPDLATANYNMGRDMVTVSYPSGSKDMVFTLNTNLGSKVSYAIFDLQGKQIRQGNIPAGSTDFRPDTNGISAGMYMVRFTDARNMSDSKKIFIK